MGTPGSFEVRRGRPRSPNGSDARRARALHVATILTREHLDMAYVAVGKKTGPSARYSTIGQTNVFDVGNPVEARNVASNTPRRARRRRPRDMVAGWASLRR